MQQLAKLGNNFDLFKKLAFVGLLLITGLAIAENASATAFKTAKVYVSPAAGVEPIEFNLKLAETDVQHSSGLMFSPPLAKNTGMLFIFQSEEQRSFWMKNTPITLDILFFDAFGSLVNLVAKAEPHSLTKRTSAAPAKYVLEIAGGEADRLNLTAGARLHLPIN